MCHRVQVDSVAKRQPFFGVFVGVLGVVTSCVFLRSRSTCVEGCSTGSAGQALNRHLSLSFVQFPPFFLQVVIGFFLLAVCSVAIRLVHANANHFLSGD